MAESEFWQNLVVHYIAAKTSCIKLVLSVAKYNPFMSHEENFKPLDKSRKTGKHLKRNQSYIGDLF